MSAGCVALRKESVDRNTIAYVTKKRKKAVALRKESVDRNANPGSTTLTFPGSLSARRAWIEIRKRSTPSHNPKLSLSARRAWIEICPISAPCEAPTVALRKESVDRNIIVTKTPIGCVVALRKESVDRNILRCVMSVVFLLVALRKESVDRNTISNYLLASVFTSLSARRAWIEMCIARNFQDAEPGRSPQGERG